MKYTKTAVALALTGCIAAPMAQADVTLTGQVAIGIIGTDEDDVPAVLDPTTSEVITAASRPGDLKMFGDDSTINVKATGTLDNGLTGYANYRTDLGLVGDVATGDNIHVGIKGDFGDIRVGEVPDATGFGQVAGDVGGAAISSDIDGENFGISYTGTFSGVTVGLNWSPEGSSDRVAAGVKFSAGGFGFGVGVGNEGDGGDDTAEDRTEMSVGATYGIGGGSLALAYKDFDNDRETISAKGSYGFGKTSVSLTFEMEAGDVNEDDTSLRFDASYDLGSSMNISTRINVFSDDSDSSGDVTNYRVLLTKAF
ncbi:hypothetical protein AB833_21255 [Chromatiales bacterium (ex Bugula neritina AB1)]|nr:hypothetical protein AB833_21255 [Chromatiales bacterium (ex Bugula neritina AB1)]